MLKKRPDYHKSEESVVRELDSKINFFISNFQIPSGQDKKVIFEKIWKRIEEGNVKQQGTSKIFFLSPVYRIAISTAAFLLLIFLLQFFLSTTHFSNNTPLANSYLLPDKSRVVLDSQSEISFPKYWWKRVVKLTGNAYFEVFDGEQFTVKMTRGRLEIIGTRFSIEQSEEETSIQCYTGMVKLIYNKSERLIPAGNSLKIKNNRIEENKEITEDYPEIAKFNLHFSQTNIKTVIEEIEYFFNVKIELKDTTLRKYFSGNISTTDYTTAINILCERLALKCEYDKKRDIFFIEETY